MSFAELNSRTGSAGQDAGAVAGQPGKSAAAPRFRGNDGRTPAAPLEPPGPPAARAKMLR